MEVINNDLLSTARNAFISGKGAYLVENPTDEELALLEESSHEFVYNTFTSEDGKRVIVIRALTPNEEINDQKVAARSAGDKSYLSEDYRRAKKKYDLVLTTTGYVGPIIYYRLGVCNYKEENFELSLYYFNLALKLYQVRGYDTKQLENMIINVEQEQKINAKKGVLKNFIEPERPSTIDPQGTESYVVRELKDGVSLESLLTGYDFKREELLLVRLIVAKQLFLQNNRKEGNKLIKQVERIPNKGIDVIKYMNQLQKNKTLLVTKGK